MKLPGLLQPLVVRREPAERVFRLAFPVILGSLSYTLLSAVDTIMLGRLGEAPLGASGIAGVFFFAIVFAFGSLSVGVQVLTARRYGEGEMTRCGDVLRAGLVLSAAIGLPLVAGAPWIAKLASPLLSRDPLVAHLGAEYLQFRLYGSAFSFLGWTYAAFYAGIGETRYQLQSSIVITIVNVVLDYGLIFGRLGLPRMEVAGAALASTLAVAAGAAYYVAISLTPRIRRLYAPYRGRTALALWVGPILRLSSPIAAQRLISHGSWFAFFFVVSRIGTVELAATNVIRSIYSLTIMIAIGMGTAASALVGQSMGARRPNDAERYAWEATKLCAYTMGAMGLLFILAPGALLRLYTAEPTVIAAGRGPLLYLGFVQIFAGIALVLSQSLQGAGNTRFVFWTEFFVCIFLYLPTVYFLGLRTPLGFAGAWVGEYVYWIALSIVMVLKFRRGGWKQIQV
jgi:putative MATE family efflux protein